MLVCDTKDHVVVVPSFMGVAREDQLQGTWFEKLSELAGRICYDSLGRGRNSADYHQHIGEVGHLSVYEHCNFAFESYETDVPLHHRPGVYWEWLDGDVRKFATKVRIVANLRSIIEWDKWGSRDEKIYATFYKIVMEYGPKFIELRSPIVSAYGDAEECNPDWQTHYVRCSRACSHELVRHGDFTAISQRSTRYCNEILDDEHLHPLLRELCSRDEEIRNELHSFTASLQTLYNKIFDKLNKITGLLKQSRGAARQVLPHYLGTEIIFSASAAQWERIKMQRVSQAADGEIRNVIASL